jgi:hypothetical protein
MRDVALPPGEKIVKADDLIPFIQKPFTKMRTQKARSASDQNAHARNSAELNSENKVRSHIFRKFTKPRIRIHNKFHDSAPMPQSGVHLFHQRLMQARLGSLKT